MGKWKTFEDNILPDQTVYGLKFGHDFCKTQKEHKLQNGQKKVPNCKQDAATGKIYEVLTEDKDYFKVIADARLKLE